jgi:APA family basic amino acid/polyamine antiporter
MVGVTIGGGIFGLPGQAAEVLGPAAILAYLICVVVVGLVGLCLAEAGSRVAVTGGLYSYADAAFGKTAATVVGTLLIVADGVGPNAAVGVLLASTVAVVFPAFGGPVPRALFLIGYYILLVAMNIRGVRYGVALSQLLSVMKLLPLVLLVLLGLPHISMANLAWDGFPNLVALGHTAVLLSFAFMGFEAALGACGEVKDPVRNVPRALFGALVTCAAVFVGLQLVAQGVLGAALKTTGTGALIETARAIFGPVGAQLIAWATIISTAGLVASDAIGSPRTVKAMADDGVLPRVIGQVHSVHQTPANAIIVYHALALLLALSGTFAYLAVFSAAGVLLMYLISCLAVLRLRQHGIVLDRPPFVVRGGAAVPLVAAAGIAVLLATLSASELLALIGLVAFALLLRLVIRPKSLSLDGSNP